ncbi:MAG: prepilin peptidase [Chthoniobacterales bacterium]|nr:prepilin peptidase [Chthoniobacterales bacterium]
MNWFWVVVSAVVGGVMGSFANACIYRMPRGIRLWEPRRSFCPSCERMIPWRENIPILSYLLLGGKCSGCGWRIPVRYLLVEVLMVSLFVGIYLVRGFPLCVGYWVLVVLLVIGAFVDWEFMILPDEVTVGGVMLGVFVSALLDGMHVGGEWVARVGSALLGAIVGFLVLYAVVELGKLAFGRKKVVFDGSVGFRFFKEGGKWVGEFDGERLVLEEVFNRPKDELEIECEKVEVNCKELDESKLRIRFDRILLRDGDEILLEGVEEIRGRAKGVVIPREAMGFGDVKLMAAIGAFLGWEGVLFTIFVGSVVGCLVGLIGVLMGKAERGTQLPFGPYLAFGALVWMLGGDYLWYMYWQGVMGGRIGVG